MIEPTMWIRRWLLKLLGLENYLLVVSRVYLWLVWTRLIEDRYPELFALEKFIRPGFHCIDIGANLGYYTVRLSRLSGPEGKVLAVEPIGLFRKILHRNVDRFARSNVEMVPYALGAKEQQVEMGAPRISGVLSHGRTRVLDGYDDGFARTFTAEMRVADRVFDHMKRMDFVKCDVEGHEPVIFRSFMNLIRRHRPVIQVEINSPENRKEMFELFETVGYRIAILRDGELVFLGAKEFKKCSANDFYFLPE